MNYFMATYCVYLCFFKKIFIQLPGEQDLPLMDMDNLALITDDVNLSMEELLSPQVSRILAATDITQTRVSVYG